MWDIFGQNKCGGLTSFGPFLLLLDRKVIFVCVWLFCFVFFLFIFFFDIFHFERNIDLVLRISFHFTNIFWYLGVSSLSSLSQSEYKYEYFALGTYDTKYWLWVLTEWSEPKILFRTRWLTFSLGLQSHWLDLIKYTGYKQVQHFKIN